MRTFMLQWINYLYKMTAVNTDYITCQSCKQQATGKYCNHCGQTLHVKRITFSSLLHEAFHFFTHLDKGFPYTLKQLISRPGKMQREYLEGVRNRHQKPFSMFLISATVFALTQYWINVLLQRFYNAGNMEEAQFFDQYMVLLLIGAVPVSTMITYIFFPRSGFNFAEIGVLTLYTVSFMLIVVFGVNCLKFIWPDLQTRWIEVPLILLYNGITFIHFFRHQKRGVVVIKSVLCAALFFLIVAVTQDVMTGEIKSYF
jgi:hypothetical protein